MTQVTRYPHIDAFPVRPFDHCLKASAVGVRRAQLTTAALSCDPLPDICRAILELDALCFTFRKKDHRFPVNKRQFLQIEGEMAARGLRGKQLLDIDYVFQVEVSDQVENYIAVLDSLDLEHSPFAWLRLL